MAKQSPPDEIEYGHPSEDISNRFAVDALLRRHGYRLEHRRPNQEPRWSLHGVIFKQSEALRRFDPRILADAEYLEDMDREADMNRLIQKEEEDRGRELHKND